RRCCWCDRVALAKRCSGRLRYRRKHRALARHRLSFRARRSVAPPPAEARPEDCRGSSHPCARRFLRAGDLFHERLVRFSMSKVSVVIPALNEEDPIAAVVRECLATGVPNEIIVADNGTTDR